MRDFAAEVRARIKNAPDSRKIVLAKRRFGGRIEYRHHTYRELAQTTTDLAAGLRARGIGKGHRALVLVTPGLDFFSILLALGGVGATPVLIDPGVGLRQMLSCIEDARVDVMFAEPRAFILKLLRRRCFQHLRLAVSVGKWKFPGTLSLGEVRVPGSSEYEPLVRSPDEVAVIAFTSGSTGPPKGVNITYANMQATNELLNELAGDNQDGVDLIALPPLAMVSIVNGRSLVMPDIDFTSLASARPQDIVHALTEHRVTTSFGSPVVYRNLSRYCLQNGIRLPALKTACSAGAPIALDVMQSFESILDADARFVTPYGATEALPVCSITAEEILRDTASLTENGAGTCVGRPIGATDVRVIRMTDQAIPEWHPELELAVGEIGEIVVRGGQVTETYFQQPRANELSKIVQKSPEGTPLVWHRMGDIGRFDEAGRLWFCGRSKHVVRHAGQVFYPLCAEGIFNAEPDIWRSALVGFDKGGESRLAIIIEFNEDRRPKRPARRRRELTQLATRHGLPLTDVFVYPKTLPTDRRHNSKIERTQLAAWAQQHFG